MLTDRLEPLLRQLLPTGRRVSNSWRIGSVAGEAGESLSVVLNGPKRGTWHDFQSDEGGDALDLVGACLGLPIGEALRWAKGWLGIDDAARSVPVRRPVPPSPPTIVSDDVARKIERAGALITRSRPIRGTIVEGYLAHRGLSLTDCGLFDPDALRFVPDAWHWPTQNRLPAMVAPVVNIHTNALQGAHLTFLAADGSDKASVDKPRLYFGPKAGGCVKLTPDPDVTMGLAIGEGIETALSALVAGYPAWACLDAGNLGAFPVLAGIDCLTVLTDHDDAGRRAANAVATRWRAAGRMIGAWTAPPAAPKGHDLNDQLKVIPNG